MSYSFNEISFYKACEAEKLHEEVARLRLENQRLENLVLVMQGQLTRERTEKEVHRQRIQLLLENNQELADRLLQNTPKKKDQSRDSSNGSFMGMENSKSSTCSLFRPASPKLSR